MLVFTYGTLMTGEPNHGLIKSRASGIRRAVVRGLLYRGPGFPYLTVPDCDVLAKGTSEPGMDALAQTHCAVPMQQLPETGQWATVKGELVEFADADVLHDLDRLEGFSALRPYMNLYDRVLVPAYMDSGRESVAAWAYIAARGSRYTRPGSELVRGGYWRNR